MAEEFEQLWSGAHSRAVSWVKLGLPGNILNDPEIPDEIRERIWSFVQGSDTNPSESLLSKLQRTGLMIQRMVPIGYNILLNLPPRDGRTKQYNQWRSRLEKS